MYPQEQNPEACIDNFNFMAISAQTGLNPGLEGILGLGANKANGPSFVWAMKDSGMIDEAILSFSLG